MSVHHMVDHAPVTSGWTRVFGCCLFEWSQAGSCRYARLEACHHARCIHELEDRAAAQGVALVMVLIPPAEDSCASS
jgi:hypothetical protein